MSSDEAQLDDTARPEVIALAMRDVVTLEPYIALTIHSPASTQARVHLDALKVALFVPSCSVEEREREGGRNEEPVWEAVFNLSRSQQEPLDSATLHHLDREDEAAEVACASTTSNNKSESEDERLAVDRGVTVSSGDIPDSACKVKADILQTVKSDDESEGSFGRGRGEYVSDSDSACDEGEGVWSVAGSRSAPGDSSFYDTDVSSVSSSMPNTPNSDPQHQHQHQHGHASLGKIFSLEGGLPEIKNNVMRTSSVAEIERRHFEQLSGEKNGNHPAGGTTNNIITMDAGLVTEHDLHQNRDRTSSCSPDPLHESKYANVTTDVNAFDIILSSSSHKMLIMKNRVDNCTTIITLDADNDAYLQETVIDASSNVATCNNTLVQWTRAVAMSGWLTKWPMQNQKVSR
jgi:hypothetical protein